MGLFNKIFKPKIISKGYWKMLNGYTPVYTSYRGGLYEMQQTKAIINTIATDCGKAIPQLAKHNAKIAYMLQHKPNAYMSTTEFIERLVTCYLCDNNAFIVPIVDDFDRTVGLYPISYQKCEIVNANNKPYAVFSFAYNQKGAIELDRVGFIKRMQYKDDIFGDSNSSLNQTLELIHSQNESVVNALKNSGAVRFMAQLNEQLIDEEDFKNQRELFSKINFGADNSQMMLYDNRYKEIKQIDSKPIYLDDKQQALIDKNIKDYFGVSDNVIQHKFQNDYEWNSYYEGVIEPILIKIGEALTTMLYTPGQVMQGNAIYMSTNRLQYMSNQSKLEFSTGLFDRGVICGNDVCDVWQLPHFDGGDKHYIRKEYAEVGHLDDDIESKPVVEPDTKEPTEPVKDEPKEGEQE